MTPGPAKRILYPMMGLMVLLSLLAGSAQLLSSLRFLPVDPLAPSLPFPFIDALARHMLELAILTGLLAAGLYLIADEDPAGEIQPFRLLRAAHLAWLLLAAVLPLILALDSGEGPLLRLWQVGQFVSLAAFGLCFLRSPGRHSESIRAFVWSWGLGLGLLLLSMLLALLPPDSDPLRSRALALLLDALRWQIACLLMALALAFWLMTRFSNSPRAWVQGATWTTAGLMSLAAGLISVAAFYSLSPSWPSWLGWLAAGFAPLAAINLLAHSYRGFITRNTMQTLAAHWFGLGLLLIASSVGVLGALLALPAVRRAAQASHLPDLQASLLALGLLAIVLGLCNQIGAEQRGTNQRITGLLPFWLITGGSFGSGLALLLIGVLQVYMPASDPAALRESMAPLYALHSLAWLLLSLGLGIYALGFRARRPCPPAVNPQ